MNAHGNTPLEHLYLELGALPLSYVIYVQRMIYLQIILKRNESEIAKQIDISQKAIPLPGDWCNLVAKDFKTMGLHICDEHIAGMNEGDYKSLIRTKVWETACTDLLSLQEGHSKVKI